MLADFQNILVHLATHKPSRNRFFQNRKTFLDAHNLTPREKDALLNLHQTHLERYAQSLLAKRRAEFLSQCPQTQKICPELGSLYTAWLSHNPAPLTDHLLSPGLIEGLRALSSLRKKLLLDEAQAPYASDVLALEILGQSSNTDGQPRQFKARYRADRILGALRRGTIPVDPDQDLCLFRLEKGKCLVKTLSPRKNA